MTTLLVFISRISLILYALAAVGIFFAIRGLVVSRRGRRVAVFGLEREAAQRQLRRSLSAITLLTLLIGLVYVIDNIILPNTEDSVQDELTPTPAVFVAQEPTATQALLLFPTITPTVGLPPAEAAEAEAEAPAEVVDGCEILGATVTRPTPGETVSGQVLVEGEANILNFAQYKFELKGPSTEDVWVVVGTYINPVQSGLLGVWDSTSLVPGNYTLRLIVHRQDGSYVTPCEVPLNVTRPIIIAPTATP